MINEQDLIVAYKVIEELEKHNDGRGISNSIVVVKNLIANEVVKLKL